ncbi:hypothetical protein [Polaromonas aquatica]|uniref:hypothetical protein n=1 Tax=Polaromonas aquatica TaxID=332657 RepID=UPI003D64FD9D
MLQIAVTGAPFTGKTQLAAALSRSLKDSGCEARIVVAGALPFPADLARCELTLLMGLEELSPSADNAANESWRLQRAADALIREALTHEGVSYRVIYGTAEQRVAQALEAAQHLRLRQVAVALPHNALDAAPQTRGSHKAWVWACEKCSDPGCEHRLLSDLLTQRASAP